MFKRVPKRTGVLRNERGGVLALTALTLPAILLVSALSVDLGLLYLAKSRAESAALFAAEAGMERMPDQVAAASLAQDVGQAMLAGTSGSQEALVDVTTDTTSITVEIEVAVKAIFGNFAGTRSMTARASVARSM